MGKTHRHPIIITVRAETTLTKAPALVSRYDSAPIEVAIFGGDPLVGRTLKLRLRDVGYHARFLDESLADEPAELLGNARLVLLGPRLSARCREVFLSSMRSAPATAGLPILELVVTSLDGAQEDGREEAVGLVRWPCRIEELKGKIEASLNGTYSQ